GRPDGGRGRTGVRAVPQASRGRSCPRRRGRGVHGRRCGTALAVRRAGPGRRGARVGLRHRMHRRMEIVVTEVKAETRPTGLPPVASYDSAVRILVVEDETKMATLLRKALEREGYAVDLADNGTEALWLGKENDYDAVVLDVMIPAPDGFEVC